MPEHAASRFIDAAREGACQLYGRPDRDLPHEKISADQAHTTAFDAVFGDGSKRHRHVDISVRRSDLRRVLRWSEGDAKRRTAASSFRAPEPATRAQKGHDYLSLESGARWLYENGSEKVKAALRALVPDHFENIAAHGTAWIRKAATRGICTVYGRWEAGLPLEKIDPSKLNYTATELAGITKHRASDLSIKRADLPDVLAWYEAQEPPGLAIAAPSAAKSGLKNVVRSSSGIDWAALDRLESFTLFEAASYWAEQRPPKSESRMSDLAQVMLKVLIEAVQEGRLEARPPRSETEKLGQALQEIARSMTGVRAASAHTAVPRANLVAFAQVQKDTPKFLFPKAR
jgi:hypothetical protein